jgi:aspartate carbamoyltransferase catalytic subunit
VRHLLSIADLDRAGIEELLDLAESFREVTQRDIPKVPALRGKVVVSLFYEDSTRTRLSFETAAKRLSCDVMAFSVASSSVKKGESLRDTVQTIEAMGIDAVVVRHQAAGTPHRIAGWIDAHVINAGDGAREHPTQALLDVFTLRRHLGPSLEGAHVAIVGDILHSRVARSDVRALTTLGARVTLVAPPTLLPASLAGWPVEVRHDLDDLLPDLDAISMLRIQRERQERALFPSLREYSGRFGLTVERAARLRPDALILHPGPMNRGVEIAAEVAESPRSVILEQVTNGVAVRMAVLYRLLGGPDAPDVSEAQDGLIAQDGADAPDGNGAQRARDRQDRQDQHDGRDG